MKFVIAPDQLEGLIKAACSARGKKKDNVTITALKNRVSVECNGLVAACDAGVAVKGAFTVHAKTFRKVLDTFKGTPSLELEVTGNVLRIQNFLMGVISFDPNPVLPGN